MDIFEPIEIFSSDTNDAPIINKFNFQGIIDASISTTYPTPVNGGYWYVKNEGYLSEPNDEIETYNAFGSLAELMSPTKGTFLAQSPSDNDPYIVEGKFDKAAYFAKAKRYQYTFNQVGQKSIRFWVKFDNGFENQEAQSLVMLRSPGNAFFANISYSQRLRTLTFGGPSVGSLRIDASFASQEWVHINLKLDFDENKIEFLVNGNSTFGVISPSSTQIAKIEIGVDGVHFSISNFYICNFIVANNWNSFDFENEISPVQNTKFFNGDILYYDEDFPYNGGWLRLQSAPDQIILEDRLISLEQRLATSEETSSKKI